MIESNDIAFVNYRSLLQLSRDIRHKNIDGIKLVRRRKGHWFIETNANGLIFSLTEILASKHISGEGIYYCPNYKGQSMLLSRRIRIDPDVRKYESISGMLHLRVE